MLTFLPAVNLTVIEMKDKSILPFSAFISDAESCIYWYFLDQRKSISLGTYRH